MAIPYGQLKVGSIYYGRHIPSGLKYYCKYLGSSEWTCGYKTSIPINIEKLKVDNAPYPPNSANFLVLAEYLVFPFEPQTINVTINDDELLDEIYEPPPKKKLTKYKVINAPRTDNTEAVFREF